MRLAMTAAWKRGTLDWRSAGTESFSVRTTCRVRHNNRTGGEHREKEDLLVGSLQ